MSAGAIIYGLAWGYFLNLVRKLLSKLEVMYKEEFSNIYLKTEIIKNQGCYTVKIIPYTTIPFISESMKPCVCSNEFLILFINADFIDNYIQIVGRRQFYTTFLKVIKEAFENNKGIVIDNNIWFGLYEGFTNALKNCIDSGNYKNCTTCPLCIQPDLSIFEEDKNVLKNEVLNQFYNFWGIYGIRAFSQCVNKLEGTYNIVNLFKEFMKLFNTVFNIGDRWYIFVVAFGTTTLGNVEGWVYPVTFENLAELKISDLASIFDYTDRSIFLNTYNKLLYLMDCCGINTEVFCPEKPTLTLY